MADAAGAGATPEIRGPRRAGWLGGALMLAVLALLLAQGTAFADYWMIPRLWLAWPMMALPLLAVALVLAVASLALAGFDLYGRRWRRGIPALALVGVNVISLATVPYGWLDILIDFHLLKRGKEEIVAEAQLEGSRFAAGKDEQGYADVRRYPLSPEKAHLALGGEVYISDTTCGRYVFLPTYFGIPDGVGGFLYVPPCAKPEDFDGETWGAKWMGATPISGGWYRIDGT